MPRDKEQRGLSLLPMMNLATLLIPVLFMGGQVIAMRWLHTEGPVGIENPGDADVHPVDLRVELTSTGLRILGAEDVLAGPNGQPVLPCLGPCSTGAYDYAALNRLLGHVKAAYPWVDEVEVLAEPSTPYPVVVKVLDAAAERDGEDLFPRIRLGTL